MGRINVLERSDTGEFERRGKKKPRNFRRVSTEEKYSNVRKAGQNESESEKTKTGKPLQADGIHVGPSIPKSVDKKSEFQSEPVDVEEKKPYYPKDDLKHWSGDDNEMLEAVVETLERAREAKLVEVKTRIEKEFDPAERRFIDPMIDDYPPYFFGEKEKADRRKVRIDENWVEAVRQFYIDERKRRGLSRQIAPEKAELLGNYLELKLPEGFPEKKTKSMDKEDKKEVKFTPDQSSELLQWIGLTSKRFKEWVEESKGWGSEFGDEETKKRAIFDQIKQEMSEVLKSDSNMKKLFSEEEISKAVEHVMKHVEKFNFDTKK